MNYQLFIINSNTEDVRPGQRNGGGAWAARWHRGEARTGRTGTSGPEGPAAPGLAVVLLTRLRRILAGVLLTSLML